MATVTTAEPKPSAWPKPWQFGLLASPLVALAALFVGLLLQKPGYVSLLWSDPMGMKMLAGAGVLLLAGAALYLGGCAVLNRVARVPWGTGTTVAQVGLVVVWALSCLPVASVLTVGPAAIQIQRNLNAG